MTNSALASQVEVSVLCGADEVAAEVCDRRPEVRNLLGQLEPEQQRQLVHDAWTIGLRALGNAHAAAQEARLGDIGGALMADLDRQLSGYIETQQQTITGVLARFFDRRDGQVSQRLSAFVDDQGVLARLLDRYLAPQNSVLAQSLARQVGESSPLWKKLSPTESEGLVKVLEGQLRAVMSEGHAELVRALDPLAEDGAVARFLRRLREELQAADQDRARQLTAAVAALDANDEQSLLSRLVRETHEARLEVLRAVNPDLPLSPLAVLRDSLVALLKEQGAQQLDLARQQQQRQEQLEKEVREALARFETRRSVAQRSPQGGLAFEDAVLGFLSRVAAGGPYVLEVTGLTVGEIDRCKKGDAVLRFTEESVFAGGAAVFEAKREAGYTVPRALAELDAARKNRNASAGVFVLARSHAGADFPRFARHGNNVLLVWDDEDAATDPYFHAAVYLGLTLVSRTRTAGEAGDMEALRDVETRIEAELGRLEKIEKCNDGIRRHADGIGEEIRKGRKALDLLLRKARDTLRALNIELQEEAIERQSPISLPALDAEANEPAGVVAAAHGSKAA